jgi:hypothetical protein
MFRLCLSRVISSLGLRVILSGRRIGPGIAYVRTKISTRRTSRTGNVLVTINSDLNRLDTLYLLKSQFKYERAPEILTTFRLAISIRGYEF